MRLSPTIRFQLAVAALKDAIARGERLNIASDYRTEARQRALYEWWRRGR